MGPLEDGITRYEPIETESMTVPATATIEDFMRIINERPGYAADIRRMLNGRPTPDEQAEADYDVERERFHNLVDGPIMDAINLCLSSDWHEGELEEVIEEAL